MRWLWLLLLAGCASVDYWHPRLLPPVAEGFQRIADAQATGCEWLDGQVRLHYASPKEPGPWHLVEKCQVLAPCVWDCPE